MRVGVVQPLHDDPQTLLRPHRAGSDFITNIHDHAPLLGDVLLAGGFFCVKIKSVSNRLTSRWFAVLSTADETKIENFTKAGHKESIARVIHR